MLREDCGGKVDCRKDFAVARPRLIGNPCDGPTCMQGILPSAGFADSSSWSEKESEDPVHRCADPKVAGSEVADPLGGRSVTPSHSPSTVLPSAAEVPAPQRFDQVTGSSPLKGVLRPIGLTKNPCQSTFWHARLLVERPKGTMGASWSSSSQWGTDPCCGVHLLQRRASPFINN